MNLDVSIVIVTYNSARHIGACLESISRECQRVTQEIIILDNNSTDQTTELVRAKFPAIKLICSERNLGFAGGVNLAAKHSQADFILLLNPDTLILHHAVDVIVNFARSNPRHGLYGGRAFKTDGSLEPSSCWGLPSLWSTAMFAFGFSAVAKRNPLLDPESLGNWQRDSVKEVGVITGCFLLASRTAWEKLGGFDERFFMYGEDVDLALRAHAAGYRPVICPAAKLVHEIGQSASTPGHKMIQLYRGKATLVRTHWQGFASALGLLLLQTGVALRAAGEWFSNRWNHAPPNSGWLVLWRERAQWLGGYSTNGNQRRV